MDAMIVRSLLRGLSKRCAAIPVCWYMMDSRSSRSRNRRMAQLAQREVVDFQDKSYLFWNQLRNVSLAAHVVLL